MPLLSNKSGFKTARDLILFITGLGIVIFHIVTTPADQLEVTLLLFGAGMAGMPSILKQDEKRDE